jgi:hypothetical protein
VGPLDAYSRRRWRDARDDFHAVAESTTVYAPVLKAKDRNTDVHQPKAKDSPALAQCRERMKSDEAKSL